MLFVKQVSCLHNTGVTLPQRVIGTIANRRRKLRSSPLVIKPITETTAMCQHMTRLANGSPFRYIAQCEHTTIHLVWDRAVLQFQPADMLFLAELLDSWAIQRALPTLCEGFIHLQRFPSGNAQCWFSGVGLFLAPPDCAMLAHMVRTAAAGHVFTKLSVQHHADCSSRPSPTRSSAARCATKTSIRGRRDPRRPYSPNGSEW